MTRLDHATSGTDKGMTIKSRQNGSILCLLCRFYGRRTNVLVVWWGAKQTEATPEDELSRADTVKARKGASKCYAQKYRWAKLGIKKACRNQNTVHRWITTG